MKVPVEILTMTTLGDWMKKYMDVKNAGLNLFIYFTKCFMRKVMHVACYSGLKNTCWTQLSVFTFKEKSNISESKFKLGKYISIDLSEKH